MVIAALISPENIPGSPLWHSLSLLSEKYPADRFIIFTENRLPVSGSNISAVNNTPSKYGFLQPYWYNKSLPRLLRKYSADIFISDTGLLSSKKIIPQFLFFNDMFLEQKHHFRFKKNLVRSLHDADKVFTAEDFITDTLHANYHTTPEKINTVYHGTDTGSEQAIDGELIKKKFTGGYDYFLCPADPSSAQHAVQLLKAFSLFKKKQKSSMKLVLLLHDIEEEGLIPDFRNYKYRDDVALIVAGEKNASALVPHAYALIYLSRYTPFNEAFIAMRNGVPVIAADTGINHALFAEAALFSAISPELLTEQMQLLYKDETLKNNTAALAYTLLQKYNAEAAAETLYSGIQDHKIR